MEELVKGNAERITTNFEALLSSLEDLILDHEAS